MFLINAKAKTNFMDSITLEESCHVQQLRQANNILPPDQIRVGGYYIYKERFGIVALVKVVKDISHQGWAGYRVMIKRVLYSTWHIPKNTELELGFSTKEMTYPTSWHFEPGMVLVKCDRQFQYNDNTNTEIDTVL